MDLDKAGARDLILRLFHAALSRVEGRAAVRDWLTMHPPEAGQWHVVAIGKAAASMALGAEEALGERLAAGLLITKHGYAPVGLHRPQRWTVRLAEHPVPGPGSLAAGADLLTFLAAVPAHGRVLFLLSGGASSLVEVLPDGCGLGELRRATTWLLGSGLEIAAMNRVRQRLSRIKGGRLRSYLGGRQARVLAISDVAGDDIRAIGSGLLAEPLDDPLPDVPEWLAGWISAAAHPAEYAAPVPHQVIAGLDDALTAAAQAAVSAGVEVHVPSERLYGDTAETATRIGEQLRDAAPGVWLWGGETTIRLPQRPGRGGRNQHFALAAAVALDRVPGVCLLAAGTDGTDGPTEDAGAIIDSGTLERGQLAGLDARTALTEADAGRFLEASGDLLTTGPTGTNVMDLVIAIKYERDHTTVPNAPESV
ncbi:glycerate kinase type-2 family protein [Acidihalobacter ferrooxydans]|uniref:Hydroxypyruvate reductase n=1 Tax=Acidihalobacter ferrooxydans TaxID=1765967 RepID=A0A1P8UID7_9GAMM|nr:DUF4147 domain-containing protein [Acidihalobacter ferrooxydans]APZ43596.1 hypothetical protein BW247_11270 [Acidihalobacter ferrooxydans]